MLLSFDAKQKLKLSVTRNKEYLSKYLLEEERVVGAMLDSKKLVPEGVGRYKYTVTSFKVFQLDINPVVLIAVENKEIIACMISQFATYPQKRVLRIIFISGEGMDRWIENFPMVENFALMNGCTFLEVWGRKAWVKILKDWDWECRYHIITKDLTARMH